MEAKTTTPRPAGAKRRGPRDPELKRALLRAMKGALRRSVVLLPLTEDDDKLLDGLGSSLGFTA